MAHVALVFAALLAGVAAQAAPEPPDAPGGPGGFRVDGTRILDARGCPFVLRGINYPHTWFKDEARAALPAIAATGANAVRLVLSDGGQYVRDDEASVRALLDLCQQHKLIAILEVHDATGSDDVQKLHRAANYWVSLAALLKGREGQVIVNIANEWMGSFDKSEAWAAGYRDVIPKLRRAGLRHLLLVDTPGWGQDASAIALQGSVVRLADPERNLAFSVHMYEVAGKDAHTVRTAIEEGELYSRAPVIVGEFADAQNGQPVDCQAVFEYCGKKDVGWLAWSWFGNNNDTANMDMATGPAGQLTTWGRRVVEGELGIRMTSRISDVWEPVVTSGCQWLSSVRRWVCGCDE